MRIKTSRKDGFTLLEIMIVVAIIGMLATIAFPNFVRARATAQANACINNLRLIDGAKQQWALEKGKSENTSPSSGEIAPYLGRGSAGQYPRCPANGSYTIGNLITTPQCSLKTTIP